MAVLKAVFECPGYFTIRKTLTMSTTVAMMKTQISNHIQEGPGDLQLCFGNRILLDSQTLSQVLQKSLWKWVGKTKFKFGVRILKGKERSSRIPSFGGASANIETLNDTILEVLKPVLELPSHCVVDEICTLMQNVVDRDTICSLYASSLEGEQESSCQAKRLANSLRALGFDSFFAVSGSKDHRAVGRANHSVQQQTLPSRSNRRSSTAVQPEHKSGQKQHGSKNSNDASVVNCPVCMEDYTSNEMFEFFCGFDQANHVGPPHALCYDCTVGHIKSAVSSNNPAIKCFAPKCDHEMIPEELALAIGHGNADAGRRQKLFSDIDDLKFNFAIGRDPSAFASCPSEGCSWTVARSAKGAIEKAVCLDCNFAFCANCRDTYHYRTTCIEHQQLKREWAKWVVKGRSRYWRHDREMLEKAQRTSARERRRVEQVTHAEKLDESWKANNCRHCPHCDRLVNKLEGCDVMRCGYDVDTKANLQNGCQRQFSWSKARPYRAVSAGKHIKIEETAAELKLHHEGWNCDLCKEVIVGLRFECVNCPSFYVCERCENRNHSPGHFFRIHTK